MFCLLNCRNPCKAKFYLNWFLKNIWSHACVIASWSINFCFDLSIPQMILQFRDFKFYFIKCWIKIFMLDFSLLTCVILMKTLNKTKAVTFEHERLYPGREGIKYQGPKLFEVVVLKFHCVVRKCKSLSCLTWKTTVPICHNNNILLSKYYDITAKLINKTNQTCYY